MKTLSDVIEKLKGKTVKIGTRNGSGFIFCDKVDDNFKRIMIVKHHSYNNRTRRLLNGVEDRLSNLDKIYEDKLEERLNTLKKIKKNFTTKKIEKIKKELKEKKAREKELLPKQINELQYCIATGFMGRPVIDKYDDILKEEKGVVIVIIKGCERGGYWTVEEYKKRCRYEKEEIY